MSFVKLTLSAASLGFLGIGLSHVACAEDWPTFRGAQRTAISGETNLLDSWPKEGPKLVWSSAGVGSGYASPAVAEGKIYTLGDAPSTADDGDEYLTCINEQDGSRHWATHVGPSWSEHKSESWNGARSTPTVDAERVYVITPHGKLICAANIDGSIIWERDLKKEFSGVKKDPWGYSESPLVDGRLLLCTPGGEKATVVALDKLTGELVWGCTRPEDVGAGHSSIVISQVAGRKVYVQNTGGGPMGIDPETGSMLWSYDMEPPTAFIPTPIIQGDFVFSVAGYNLGGALLQQIPGANGKVSIKEIYGPIKDLANKHGGVVLIDGKIYGANEDKNTVFCADLKSGAIEWRERGAGTGSTSVAAADDMLFLRFQNGTVALAKVDPAEYIEISSFNTPGSGGDAMPSWAHPVIANGKLLLREGDTILCYDIGG